MREVKLYKTLQTTLHINYKTTETSKIQRKNVGTTCHRMQLKR